MSTPATPARPPAPVPSAAVHEHQVGEVRLTSLVDVAGSFPAPFPAPFTGMTEAQWSTVRRDHPLSLGDGHWTATVRATLISSPGATVLVDTGIGSRERDYARALDTSGRLPDLLAALGTDPDDIDIVVITHPHADHVGWNLTTPAPDAPATPTFPSARYLLHHDAWSGALAESEHPFQGLRYFEENIAPLTALGVADLVDGDAVLAPGISLMDTPGHAPGHVVVHVQSCDEHALIVGDAAVHPLQLTLTHAGFFADTDPSVAATTRETLVERALDLDAVITGAHFPGSGFGRLHRHAHDRVVWHDLAV